MSIKLYMIDKIVYLLVENSNNCIKVYKIVERFCIQVLYTGFGLLYTGFDVLYTGFVVLYTGYKVKNFEKFILYTGL
jgi:hypothetical protein